MLNLEKLERQLKLEEEMRGLGVTKYRKEVEKAKARGAEATTAYGMSLLSQAIEPTSLKIQEMIKDHASRTVSHQGIAYPILKQLTPDVLAFLTVKAVLDTISLSHPFTQACVQVAKLVEDELIHRQFMRDHRLLFRSMKKSFKERSAGETYQRQVVRLLAKRKGVSTDIDWNINLRINLGSTLIGAFIDATGMIRVSQRPIRGKTESYLEPADKTLEWINGKNAFCELLTPTYLPCVVPPKPWTSLYDGGFYTDMARLSFVKTRDKKYRKRLETVDMPEVYDSVNLLQNTAWKVNPDVYSVLRQMVDQDVTLGVIPKSGSPDLPPKPHDMDTNEEAKKTWKAAAREAYNLHTKTTSRRLSLMKQVWVAEKVLTEEEIFFVYTLDFRGRAYPAQLFLHPQGDDVARALLTFAEAKPLGNDGACWLAIHGANMFGFDKASLQERIDWAMEHQDKIVACAADPFSNRWWTEADKPFMFLAFCFEWKGYAEQGESYASSLPVSMDGSCNGLQNFSAMLLDEVGGAAVNLVPGDKPSDVYGLVATKAAAIMETLDDDKARWWHGRITRSICKRPVMTLPYGVTKLGMIEQIAEELVKMKNAGQLTESFSELSGYASYFGKLLFDVIADTLVAAPKAMDWLRAVAEEHTKAGLPIEWVTPVGFPVCQAYYSTKAGRVTAKASNVKVRPQIGIYTNKLNPKQQKNGISPNFVHSMDAAHMMKTVLLANDNGLKHFAMVHDSFGAHAADAVTLGMALRHSFVAMYRENDVVETAYQKWVSANGGEAKVHIPLPPSKGSLDLERVLESEFFFA